MNLLQILVLCCLSVYGIRADQTNDFFHSSAIVEGTSVSVRTRFENPTVEAGEPGSSSGIPGTLWWSWTPPAAGRVILTAPSFFHGGRWQQALIATYTGSAVDQLEALNPRRQGVFGSWVFQAEPGVVYHFQLWPYVDGAPEETGFDLALYPFEQADNDDFAEAAPLDGTARSTLGATREPGEPAHASGGPNKSLWWKWTAPNTHAGASMSVGWGTLTNVTIAIYQGETVDTLQLMGKGVGRANFSPTATESYYIAAEVPESTLGDIEMVFSRGSYPATGRTIPGNLVANPSFETGMFEDWAGSYGGGINEGSADGRNYSSVSVGSIWQDIATVEGHPYRLRFTSIGQHPSLVSKFSVWFGGVKLGVIEPGGWSASEFFVTATTNLSRLEFRGEGGLAAIDQVSLVSMAQAPVVITQPWSLTLFRGSSSYFHAGVSGTEPMQRQWFFNGEAIAGATHGTLPLNSVEPTQAGTYYFTATNAFGRIETEHVTLTVEVINDLQIVLQPEGDRLFAGQYHVLQTAGVSSNPITYQWFHNGTPVPDATNSALIFTSFAEAQTGAYYVVLSSAGESSISVTASLAIQEPTGGGGGNIEFSNHTLHPEGIDAPVFDSDGNTRLSGGDFVAQLYAGRSADLLRPVGEPRIFREGNAAGIWMRDTVFVPHVDSTAPAYVQVRVWDRTVASSYEAARALGGKFGRSEVLEVVPGDPTGVRLATPLTGLTSFQLQLGLPAFVTGHLALLELQEDGTMVWQLTGAAGFRYLIERKSENEPWTPFQVITNATGTATFTDTAANETKVQVYRARILD